MKKQEEKINDALLKVALGYQVAEVTEEYAEEDGELKLVKRKKTKKDVPPDLKAMQLLLSEEEREYGKWTDEQLEEEKARLLEGLSKAQGIEQDKSQAKKTTAKKSTTKKSKTKKSAVKKKKQGEKVKK